MFPATVTPLGPNHLTVKRVDNVGASLEWQGRNVTTVPMAISTSKKEDAQVCSSRLTGHIHSLVLGAVTVCSTGFPEIKGQQISGIKYLT